MSLSKRTSYLRNQLLLRNPRRKIIDVTFVLIATNASIVPVALKYTSTHILARNVSLHSLDLNVFVLKRVDHVAFECPFPGCGRNFNVSSNMRRHFRNHSNSISSTGSSASASVTSSPAPATTSLPASPRMPAQPSPALSASSSGTTYTTTSSDSYVSSRDRSPTPSDDEDGIEIDVAEADIRNSSLSYTRSTALASYTFPAPPRPLSGKKIPSPLPLVDSFKFKRIDF